MRSTAEQASDWLVLLREIPDDPSARDRFEAWLDAEPENAIAWVAATDTFEAIGEIGPELEAHWRHAGTEPVSVPQYRRSSRWSPRAGGSRRVPLLAWAVAACLALWFAPVAILHVQSDYVTGPGEVRALRLPDGSTVRMGPSSAMAVDYGKRERVVRLIEGQAWFEVVHDPAAPFSVDAGTVRTTVLGTSFDVRRIGGDTAISLKRGRVRVVDHGAASTTSRELTPGQWVRVDADHAIESGRDNPALLGAWQTGTLVARDRPIAEMIEELRPWYAGRIVLLDADLGRKRVDGVYNARDPQEALAALVSHAGGKMRRITPWLIVIS
ncbi:FecR family protein [Novosphingobium resinovorum]|uniref:FecR family protein n=1 Tax=Novosphingobium resinovorum TaxID=158500 RepID=UPI002ED6BC48|nr:FecR family protein [Novosphingobium resinovorum]